MRTSLCVVSGGFLLSAAAVLAAPVNYISQDRGVSARAGDTDEQLATDFGSFTGVASASATNEDTSVSASARMTSDLTQTIMSFVGRLELTGEDLDPNDDVLENLGQSADAHNVIIFDLTLPHTFHATQSFAAEGSGDRQGFALLSGPDNFSVTFGPEDSGVLQPGQYRLDFNHNLTSEAGIPITAAVDFSQVLELAVIPLPAAVWPGLGLLAALGARAVYGKRRHVK